jgi:hypothetical protein
MNGGADDMARWLPIQLLNPLAQVRFHDGDSAVLQVRRHGALFLQHRFALDQFLNAVLSQDRVDNLVVFTRVSCPVNLNAALDSITLELLQILVQVSERVFLDLGGKLAKLFPLRQ